MKSELKILFENIKNFRLLSEGVGESGIVDAINNHEWIYIYYDAGDEEGKNATGYRTVRPYVLGTNSAGNTVLRAWQDNSKNSWHFSHKPTRPDSQYHDYWTDREGSKPGWRLFNIDKISKIYPTGKKFNDANGMPMIPSGYREGADKDMTSIIAYVSTDREPEEKSTHAFDTGGGDMISKADRLKEKWNSIRRGNKNRKQITADDVIKLRDVASRVQKTAHGKYLVVIDDKNNFQLMLASDKAKQNIPDQAIVGSLPYLYDSLVKNNAPSDDKFFKDAINKTQSELKMKSQNTLNQPEPDVNQPEPEIKENDKQTIPYKKMTFFK